MFSLYRLVLVVHIVAVISWMAGILYLYRLLINHAERGRKEAMIHELISGMEDRLYRIITKPAMLVATFAGIGMLGLNPPLLHQPWMMAKLVAVVCLIGATAYAKALMTVFANITNPVPTGKKLRWLNEVPTILMIIIVALVILRPFNI